MGQGLGLGLGPGLDNSWDDPPHPTSQKKLAGGQQDQGHEVVHHDQREGSQQPKSSRNRSVSVPQSVKEVSHLGPKFHILFRTKSNTISWA